MKKIMVHATDVRSVEWSDIEQTSIVGVVNGRGRKGFFHHDTDNVIRVISFDKESTCHPEYWDSRLFNTSFEALKELGENSSTEFYFFEDQEELFQWLLS